MPQSEQENWIIEAQDLERRFHRHKALTGIDLKVRQGEIFGILGPDGAGKTTLMQLLAAILDPTSGHCRVLGFDSVREAAAITSRIGYMSQGFTLYDRLTVDENLVFSARVRGVQEETFAQRRQQLLKMAGLEPFSARRAGTLSGGMRKKLSLCTNLIHEPPLLLLDELSLGVDPASRRELWKMLRAFRTRGITVVLTTPYMDEAAYCDRLAFLHQGRLLAMDSPERLCALAQGSVYELVTKTPRLAQQILMAHSKVISLQWLADRLRFQFPQAASLPRTLRSRLDALGALRQVEPDLESAFIQMTTAANEQPEAAPQFGAAVQAAGESHREAVAVSGVTVRFGHFTAVENITVTVSPGEVIGWLGPNGAGKTTLIRVLCGLLRPSAGTVHVAGVDVLRNPRHLKGRIGYLSQRFSLYPDLTVTENLQFFAGVYGLSGQRRRDAAHWVKQITGLTGMEARLTSDLSGALRQRLALACAIIHQPSVLFLDEPTSGIDPLARQRFWQLIQTLAGTGMAVLVTTHYLEEAHYCHRLGLMFQGRLIALGTIPQLRDGLQYPELDERMEAIFMAYLERAAGKVS